MRNTVLTTALLGAALTLSACGGDGDGGTGPGKGNGNATLTAAQATELSRALLGMGAGVTSQGGARSKAPTAQGSGNLSFNFNETEPCDPSGTIRMAGTMGMEWDDEAETTSISADFSLVPSACAHRLESGEVIAITGDPDIDVTMDASTGPDGIAAFRITETGAFTWSKDGGNGRCTLDVTADLVPATGQVAISGSFCGIAVSGILDPEA